MVATRGRPSPHTREVVANMAGDWIKMRTNLGDDPRVHRVAELLRMKDPDLVVGKLWRLWSYADEYTKDGFIAHITPEILDRRMGMKGLSAALAQVGWLTIQDGGGVTLPHFAEHNGKSAKDRHESAIRQQEHRRRNGLVTNIRDGPVTPSRKPSDESVIASQKARYQDETRRDESFLIPNRSSECDGPEVGSVETKSGQEAARLANVYLGTLAVTGETDNGRLRALYVRYYQRLGQVLYDKALSETKVATLEGSKPDNVGAYFVAVCKNIGIKQGISLDPEHRKAAG